MNFDNELRQLKNIYREASRKIDKYISDGEQLIKEIDKAYSNNVGKVESLIDAEITNIGKQIDEIVRSYEKEISKFTMNWQEDIRNLESNYIDELKSKKKLVLQQIPVNLKNAMTIKGEF